MSDEKKMLTAADIPWTSDPLPRLELLPVADLLALDEGDLLVYAADLQRELLAMRELLHASFTFNARVTIQRDRALDLVQGLRAERPK